MKKVDHFSVQFKYTGSFDSYTKEDLVEMGKAQMFRADPYDHTVEVDDETADIIVDTYFITDLYPCNKIASMCWYTLSEEEEE